MFDFTTTTILNSFDASKDVKGSLATGLSIKNVGTFKKDEILKVTSKAYTADVAPTATLKIAAPTAGKVYRLTIDIEVRKTDSSVYARPGLAKGKPVYVEALATDANAVTLATALSKNASEYMALIYDTKILNITNAPEGSNTDTLTITGVEGAQILKNIVLERWDANSESYSGGSWVNVSNAEGYKPSITAGTVGFGTYKHLIQNVVLPTYENIRYQGDAGRDVPELEGQYYQIIVTKRAVREGISGTGAVGQEIVSVTNHVFWVKGEANATAVEGLFKTGSSVLDE